MGSSAVLPWVIFGVLVVVMLVVDLGLAHRGSQEIKLKSALRWSAIWFGVAVAFMGFVAFSRNTTDAATFFTGYIVEWSLSVDNLFVFIMLFSYFKVPVTFQHKVLFYGIIGALILRGLFVGVGVVALQNFHWLFYVFGAILVFTGIKTAFEKEESEVHPEKNPVIKLLHRFLPVTKNYEGDRFFVRRDGKLWATPLFVVVLAVETTDVVFAVDSVPAVLSISQDPFIVYTSNVFAILGLRSLFFALAGLMPMFKYLRQGIAVILCFIGVKMLGERFGDVPIGFTLGFIAAVLALSVLFSVAKSRKDRGQAG